MTVTVEKFVESLVASGLMTAADIEAFVHAQPEAERPRNSQELARSLVAQRRLTRFQAIEIYQGRPEGLVLGNYVLLDRLGIGGMGIVFKAQHRVMKRVVALKTLPRKIAKSPSSIKRFHREVEAAARLTHPNIVTAYDADEFRGTHFLVMEYVEGSDLAHYVRRCGKLSQHKAIDYTLQAARGLDYAHQRGVIHRDIKPGNLLLDGDGCVRVLDMGLARLEAIGDEQAASDSHEDLTNTGRVVGTVDYMAPEQGVGSKQLDRRADIYSLGCTLHFLLTGRAPTPEGSMTEKLLWHQTGHIPSLLALRGDVSPRLEQVFRRMMARKPADRYASMAELMVDLQSCLDLVKADSEATLDLGPVKAVELKPDDFVVPEVVEIEAPPPGETSRVQVKREPTLVDSAGRNPESGPAGRLHLEPSRTLVANRSRAQRQERQIQIVAASVMIIGLLGGLTIWGLNTIDWQSASGGWNRQVRQTVEKIYTNGVETDAGRQAYSDIDTAIEMGLDGDWWIASGLTRDKQAYHIRLRNGDLAARSISGIEAVDAQLVSPMQVRRSIDSKFRARSEILLTLDRPALQLTTAADGQRRVTGRVFGTLSGDTPVTDLVFTLRGTKQTGNLTHSSEEFQRRGEQSLSTGWIEIDIPIDNVSFEIDGVLELFAFAFLYEPKPGIYRISNELPVTLSPGTTSAATLPGSTPVNP
jgi:serine/threonine protein kinase